MRRFDRYHWQFCVGQKDTRPNRCTAPCFMMREVLRSVSVSLSRPGAEIDVKDLHWQYAPGPRGRRPAVARMRAPLARGRRHALRKFASLLRRAHFIVRVKAGGEPAVKPGGRRGCGFAVHAPARAPLSSVGANPLIAVCISLDFPVSPASGRAVRPLFPRRGFVGRRVPGAGVPLGHA